MSDKITCIIEAYRDREGWGHRYESSLAQKIKVFSKESLQRQANRLSDLGFLLRFTTADGELAPGTKGRNGGREAGLALFS